MRKRVFYKRGVVISFVREREREREREKERDCLTCLTKTLDPVSIFEN